MSTDIETWVKNCVRCILRRSLTSARAQLVNIHTSQPRELVSIDYLTLEPSKGGFEYIPVITHLFTRFAQAIPTRNQTAKTTAEVLVRKYFFPFGIPLKLHSDQGAAFASRMIKELCYLTGIKKNRSSLYRPSCNGMTEGFNCTLLSMLCTLDPSKKFDLKAHVATLTHAYSATKHDSTAQCPYLLMFARQPRLPIDLALGLPDLREEKSIP